MDRYTTYVSHHCSPLFVEAGLEVRDPFTDPRLMRFLLSCPPQIHKGNGESKHLLREATRGVLPELVRTRTTKGRLSRPIFAALHQQAQHFRRLALTQPACLMPFLDAHRLAHVLEHVLWIAEIPQPSLFSSLALLGWAHRQKRKEE